MSEPKRYLMIDVEAKHPEKVDFFRADDPTVVEAFKKAELYDKGDAEWRAKLEKEYRDTIETLKAQILSYAEENKSFKRSHDALDKLERMVKTELGLSLLAGNETGIIIMKALEREPVTAPSLISAIEAVKEE